MKVKLFLFAALICAVSVVSAITSAQRKPVDEKPITGDFKITSRMTVAGNTTQSTTMIKGKRERTETSISAGTYSMSMVSITQCDMRRTIQVNDKARKYIITPLDTDDTSSPTTTTGSSGRGTSRSGGVVTMTVNTVDTGERKEMFGFTARHLKRTTSFQSSPDACSQQQMKMDTDGWYINLEYGLNCGSMSPSQNNYGGGATGCRDRYEYKTTGPQNLGYPLVETTTMYGADGSVTTTITKEVVELSRQTLDAALFDIPAGYAQASSQQEMYAGGMTSETMSTPRPSTQPSEATGATTTSIAKTRVGVVEINNKTKGSVSLDALRERLIAELSEEGIEAIPLNASAPSEAVIEAQAKDCAYILYTDIATLKSPSTGKKIGGLFGRAAGVGSGDSGKAEVRLDFRLVPTSSTSALLQSSTGAKEETQDITLNLAVESEARAVAAAIPRN
ncbi:MAG TPA: hypothetical protein VJT71_08365 [Pyrinomonadaceae bacterium]|nr:hypothetical protein [Pyrinomonadaceae bacterium]